jgi:hypothetical protein
MYAFYRKKCIVCSNEIQWTLPGDGNWFYKGIKGFIKGFVLFLLQRADLIEII